MLKKRKLGNKYDLIYLFFEAYNYDVSFENAESPEKLKEEKSLEILTPHILLTRLAILIAQKKG